MTPPCPACASPSVSLGGDDHFAAESFRCTREGCNHVFRLGGVVRSEDDPLFYSVLVDESQIALIAQWAFDYRIAVGSPLPVPAALYELCEKAGCTMKDMEKTSRKLY